MVLPATVLLLLLLDDSFIFLARSKYWRTKKATLDTNTQLPPTATSTSDAVDLFADCEKLGGDDSEQEGASGSMQSNLDSSPQPVVGVSTQVHSQQSPPSNLPQKGSRGWQRKGATWTLNVRRMGLMERLGIKTNKPSCCGVRLRPIESKEACLRSCEILLYYTRDLLWTYSRRRITLSS